MSGEGPDVVARIHSNRDEGHSKMTFEVPGVSIEVTFAHDDQSIENMSMLVADLADLSTRLISGALEQGGGE